MSAPTTSASASSTFYCEPCGVSFAGKKERDRHMRNAKAHSSGITCYHPECSKTYQKWESLYKHVGRDHRAEIELLLLQKYESMEGWAPQQHVASGSYGTTSLTGTQYIVDDSHAGFQQMAGNTPVSSDATISVAHMAGLSTSSVAFAEPQHMYGYGYVDLRTGGIGAQQTLPYNNALSPYTMTRSAVGTTAPLLPSASQFGPWSTPAGSLNYTYPMREMLPAPVPSYTGPTGQYGDNNQGQGTLTIGAASSGAYMDSPEMLDDGAETYSDGYN